MTFAVRTTVDTTPMQGNRRVLIGVGLSIAVHTMLMFAYRHAGPSLPAFEPESSTPIAVTILRPAPAPPVEAAPPPRVEKAPAPRPRAEAPRRAARPAPQELIAVPAAPRQEAAPDPFVVEQAPAPASSLENDAPRFDMNAAKSTARALAGQRHLGREDTALAQFPDPPLETETKAARAIGRTKRANCKDGLPGGLLAPLFLMMDKKDHGCKW